MPSLLSPLPPDSLLSLLPGDLITVHSHPYLNRQIHKVLGTEGFVESIHSRISQFEPTGTPLTVGTPLEVLHVELPLLIARPLHQSATILLPPIVIDTRNLLLSRISSSYLTAIRAAWAASTQSLTPSLSSHPNPHPPLQDLLPPPPPSPDSLVSP